MTMKIKLMLMAVSMTAAAGAVWGQSQEQQFQEAVSGAVQTVQTSPERKALAVDLQQQVDQRRNMQKQAGDVKRCLYYLTESYGYEGWRNCLVESGAEPKFVITVHMQAKKSKEECERQDAEYRAAVVPGNSFTLPARAERYTGYYSSYDEGPILKKHDVFQVSKEQIGEVVIDGEMNRVAYFPLDGDVVASWDFQKSYESGNLKIESIAERVACDTYGIPTTKLKQSCHWEFDGVYRCSSVDKLSTRYLSEFNITVGVQH